MKTVLLLFYTFFLHVIVYGSEPSLFPVLLHGKVGYIDRSGKLVIPAIYHAGGVFAEGLAPVREGGLYGYIDEKGAYHIPPQFEYALPFQGGFAIVHSDGGKPFFINKEGKRPFPILFKTINNFERGRAKVTTYTDKQGFIDAKGKLIIDTIFKVIRPFSEGRAVVEGINHDTKLADGNYKKEVGVIDTLGNLIVSYGRFSEIRDYKNGYAYFDLDAAGRERNPEKVWGGFIDRNGQVVLSRNRKDRSWIGGDISNGIARINLYKHWLPEEKGILYTTTKSYEGFINLQGELVLNDTTIMDTRDFTNGLSFVCRKEEDYYMIDTSGKRVSAVGFQNIAKTGFRNGFALARQDYKWGVINQKGEWVVSPTFEEINEYYQFDDYFFYTEQVKDKKGEYNIRYGVAAYDGRVIAPAVFEQVDDAGFQGGLLKGVVEDKLVYMDSAGKFVWSTPDEEEPSVETLNIDYMNRGYYYATQSATFKDYQGWAKSNNTPRKSDLATAGNGVKVMIDTSTTLPFDGKYKGYQLTVVNASGQTITFNAQDSRLSMTLQAVDQHGEWRDIEYLPSSWCGNSYHTLQLKSREAWDFTIPVYEGIIPTKIRAKLHYVDPKDKSKDRYKRKELVTYSNEIRGGVNPAQFWRKPGYSLMDPYYE